VRQSFGVVGSTIEIGGDLAEDALFDLLAAAEVDLAVLEGRQHEYDDEDLRRAIAAGKPLRFTRASANQEEFVELEEFCRSHALTYRRFGDGGAAAEPGVLYWAPGIEPGVRVPADARGRVYLTLAELERSADAGQTLADVVSALRAASGRVPPLHIIVD
jgi:hypothetical protein